jgi:hypothetical protein
MSLVEGSEGRLRFIIFLCSSCRLLLRLLLSHTRLVSLSLYIERENESIAIYLLPVFIPPAAAHSFRWSALAAGIVLLKKETHK